MSGVELHRIERVLREVAFEVGDRDRARRAERRRIGLDEHTEEWHVAATGFITGGADFVFADATIEFSMDFFDAPEQRRADILTPTFHYGSFQPPDDESELMPGNKLVVATAVVREWTQRNDGAFIGAVVTCGAFMPNAVGTLPFDVLYHLSFSGWGAPFDLEANEPDTGDGQG